MALSTRSFEERVDDFLSSEKEVLTRIRWKSRGRQDFAEASARIVLAGTRQRTSGKFVVTAHRLISPPKYSFFVLFGGERVLALDVNPGRSHRNILTKVSVSSTHWQRWPLMDAEVDERQINFSEWLAKFLCKAKIKCKHPVSSPPFGMQLEFRKW
jgi:hypothetical protein